MVHHQLHKAQNQSKNSAAESSKSVSWSKNAILGSDNVILKIMIFQQK